MKHYTLKRALYQVSLVISMKLGDFLQDNLCPSTTSTKASRCTKHTSFQILPDTLQYVNILIKNFVLALKAMHGTTVPCTVMPL